MVRYETRVYYEKDSKAMGADVLIYEDSNDEPIDRILITTQSKYDELVEQISEITTDSITQEELLEIIENVSNQITINATSLGGYPADDYSKTDHSHGDIYAPKNHASTFTTYGVGSNNNYGHVKVVDNLSSTAYRDGEVLSARMGNTLNGRIDDANSKVDGVNITKFNNPTSAASMCGILLKKVGNTVFCQYNVAFNAPTDAQIRDKTDVKVSKTLIPEGFRPISTNFNSVAEYDSNNNMLLTFRNDGNIYCRGYKKTNINVYGTCFWFTDIEFFD